MSKARVRWWFVGVGCTCVLVQAACSSEDDSDASNGGGAGGVAGSAGAASGGGGTGAGTAGGSGGTGGGSGGTTTSDSGLGGTGGSGGGAAGAAGTAGAQASDAGPDVDLGPPQPAKDAELTSGFINVGWHLPAKSGGYDEVSMDIRPEVSGPTTGPLQYFAFGAHQFTSGPQGNGFYGGLQTRIGNQTAHSGKRGVIFSTWGVVTAIPHGNALADIDKVSCDGGIGAVCAQLSIAYEWKNGVTYRMRYWLAGPAPSAGNQLFRASVTDLSSGQETILGDAVVPNSWGKLPTSYFTFDETFPGPNGPLCTDYNPSDIFYTRMRANKTVEPNSWAQYATGYTGPCIDLFHYSVVTDGYRMRLGIYVAP